MNTSGYGFDKSTENAISSLESNGRIPHAVIIEGSDKAKTLETAKFLSMYAVCRDKNKPCMQCSQCHKAMNKAHADIYYAYPEKKSGIYTVEQIHKITEDASIRPNEADAKVYIFEDAENRLDVVQQNALLKLIEEPPQNVNFVFTCQNSLSLLATIRSRCTAIKLRNDISFDDEITQKAEAIVNGIISSREYDLLKALNVLVNKDKADDVLSAVSFILRDGLVASAGGESKLNAELGKRLSLSFTKDRLLKMIELTDEAKNKITRNININLLTTWLCGEYRRISWQR